MKRVKKSDKCMDKACSKYNHSRKCHAFLHKKKVISQCRESILATSVLVDKMIENL